MQSLAPPLADATSTKYDQAQTHQVLAAICRAYSLHTGAVRAGISSCGFEFAVGVEGEDWGEDGVEGEDEVEGKDEADDEVGISVCFCS